MRALSELVRPNILKLKPYSSARDEFDQEGNVQLDANENPFESNYNRYPDPYQNELKKRLSELKGLNPVNLILGNGSDEIIDLILRTFCVPRQDNIISIKPSYGMYRVSAAINDVELIEVALKPDFSLNAQDLIAAINEKTKIIFLCSPNNPTGNTFDDLELVLLLENFNGIVVIDEAYIDFSVNNSWSKRLTEYPQLIVLQTLSKAFGLASLRVGMAWASSEIITVLNKVKPPYNVNGASQAIALEMLSDEKQLTLSIASIKEQKALLSRELKDVNVILKQFPSDANFILIKVENATELYDYLCSNKVVVRNRTNEYGCDNCLRVSVGTPLENKKLIKLLKNY
jgi:histidinol-phosphate aminotransferase